MKGKTRDIRQQTRQDYIIINKINTIHNVKCLTQ